MVFWIGCWVWVLVFLGVMGWVLGLGFGFFGCYGLGVGFGCIHPNPNPKPYNFWVPATVFFINYLRAISPYI
jgi:hypothetical protein